MSSELDTGINGAMERVAKSELSFGLGAVAEITCWVDGADEEPWEGVAGGGVESLTQEVEAVD